MLLMKCQIQLKKDLKKQAPAYSYKPSSYIILDKYK